MATNQSTNDGALRLPLRRRCGDRWVVAAWMIVRNDEFSRSLLFRWRGMYHAEHGYARTGKKYIHHIIFYHYHGTVPYGMMIDHRDRDRLNNTPENLRLATGAQNRTNRTISRRNSTGYQGVYFAKDKIKKKWRAYMSVSKKRISLGYFLNPEEAAIVVNEGYAKYYPDAPVPNPTVKR